MGVLPGPLPQGTIDLILDGLIGYTLRCSPHGPAADLIGWANGNPAPVLSLDMPSGFDAGAGQFRDPAIHADATLTLALPKMGLQGVAQTGDLYLADISVPPALFAGLTPPLVVPLFRNGDILHLV